MAIPSHVARTGQRYCRRELRSNFDTLPKVALTGVTVVIDKIGSVDIDLPDDRLKALAKELNGRMVAVTGELSRITVIPRAYRAAISGIELQDDKGRTIWIPLGGE